MKKIFSYISDAFYICYNFFDEASRKSGKESSHDDKGFTYQCEKSQEEKSSVLLIVDILKSIDEKISSIESLLKRDCEDSKNN